MYQERHRIKYGGIKKRDSFVLCFFFFVLVFCMSHKKIEICYIREFGSTLYVGLARAVSPTNTNFRLTFLLTRLQEALYEDLAV